MFCQQTFVDPGHGWKTMNKVYNVTSEATGLPTNNTDIINTDIMWSLLYH